MECVIHEYPPQSSASDLGMEIVNFITQSPQFSVAMIVYSGENKGGPIRAYDAVYCNSLHILPSTLWTVQHLSKYLLLFSSVVD